MERPSGSDLLKQIQSLRDELQVEMSTRFDRDLPFEELLSDRWERARRLGFGEGASIYSNAYVMSRVSVGKGTWVGPFVMLDGRGGIDIGDWCSVSTGVQIYTHDTVKWALSGGKAEYEMAPVRIGDCTYLGGQVVILKGVTVGDHCVIGAHSLVNTDIPPYSVAFGVPARVRGSVAIDQRTGAIELRIGQEHCPN
jgi:acetyltransferase-like isoleucine patch superfamily enzyme